MSHQTCWHITHLKKKIFLKFFLGFFVNFLCCTSPNSKKSICSENLKVLPIWNRWHLFDLSIFLDFVAILKKKSWPQNFFFRFLKITFSEHNSARFDKKIFLKISKKNFQKIFFFFQMWNESTCVIRHKSKLYETKPPHLRNTWIAFLWSKCLYYCHINQSKYKS